MILQTNPGVDGKKVPAGKVSCPLCGGFISVSGGDRARFVDHMTNEHDAKTDCHQVLLAISVLDEKERGFLVKSTSRRLDSIGRNKPPNYSDSFLRQLSGNTAPPAPAPGRTKSQSSRAAPARQPRAAQKQPIPRAAPVQSSFLRGNSSISVSKVDMSRTCNMCPVRVASPGALIEHLNNHHFNLPGGINIMTRAQRSQAVNAENEVNQRRQAVTRRSQPQPVRNSPSSRQRTMEVVKCPSCGKSVEKSKFAIHKLSHSHQRKPTPTRANVVKNKGISLQKLTNEGPITQKTEDVELVEIVDDTEDVSPGATMEESAGGDQADTENDSENDQAVRTEIEKLDTLELLDNLVNFLQT